MIIHGNVHTRTYSLCNLQWSMDVEDAVGTTIGRKFCVDLFQTSKWNLLFDRSAFDASILPKMSQLKIVTL